MGWMVPAAKNGAKLAAKYGPQAKIAWDNAGKPAAAAAATKAQAQLQRRKAFAKAATVVDGSVLKLQHQGEPTWVVLTAGDPVEAFPPVDVALSSLLSGADLSKAVSSADFEAKRVAARLERARRRVGRESSDGSS